MRVCLRCFLLLMRLVRGIHALRRPRNIHHAHPDIICMVVQVPGIHVKNVRRGIRTRRVGTLVKACDIRHVKT